MDETQLRLDGNAAAGILREIFMHEMSAARSACASRGTIAQIGSQLLYMYPLSPGAVLRCHTCRDVLMVFVRAGGRAQLGLQGLAWLEMPDAAEVPADRARGHSVSLSEFRGQPVILAFYPADWGPVCGDQMALYNEVLPEFTRLGAELLGISVDGVWCHLAFTKDRALRCGASA